MLWMNVIYVQKYFISMKKILFRKLLSDYLKFMILSLISASIVIWVFQAVNYLDIMIEDGRDYLVYLKFSALNFPKIVSKIFPFILFFSLFYITIKYELSNELMIFWNFGIQKIHVINFILKFSLILMIFQMTLTSLIVPMSQEKARFFIRTSSVNFFGNFIKPQRFNDTIKGVTIYSDRRDKNGNLYNLYLKKELGDNDFQITYAKKGEFIEIRNTPVLVLYEGATITSRNKEITNISFSKSDFSLANLETNTTTYIKTQEISSLKILKCIQNFYIFNKDVFEKNSKNLENCSLNNIQNIMKEFYKRLIIPFYIPILSLIPFLLISTSKENPKYYKMRIFTFLFGLGLIIFSETTIRFISILTLQNIIFVSIPILAISIFYLFLFYQFKANLKI